MISPASNIFWRGGDPPKPPPLASLLVNTWELYSGRQRMMDDAYMGIQRLYILTILMILSTVYRQFSFLGTILAESVVVSTTEFIFASYFSRPIPLENLRNLLIRFRRFVFYSATILYISQLQVLYSIYVIMYVRGNQLTRTTDHGPRTMAHFKSFLLPDDMLSKMRHWQI